MSRAIFQASLSTSFPNSEHLQSWWVEDVWGWVESVLVKLKIRPNQISVMGLILCLLASLALAYSYFLLGAWALLVSTSFDFLDGRIARKTGLASSAGSFLDSVLDRYADFFILAGLSFHFKQDDWVFLMGMLAILGSQVTPYIRAKSESLGIECRVGIMQRPQRLAVLGVSSLICGLWSGLQNPLNWGFSRMILEFPLVLGIGIVAFFSIYTSIRRFQLVFRKLSSA